MANKEKIDYLLIDIRELEKLVAGMRGRGNLSRLFLQPDLPVDPQGIEGASYAGGVSVRGFA